MCAIITPTRMGAGRREGTRAMFERDLASYRNRREAAANEAVKAILSGSYQTAILKLSDAIAYKAAEEELRFQREAMR